MKPHIRKRYTLLASALLVVGGCALACFLWVRAEPRQYRMNRELIESLRQVDIKRALKLVEEGANPNTRMIQSSRPSFKGLLQHLVKPTTTFPNRNSTAFLFVCGDSYFEDGTPASFEPLHNSDRTLLVKQMIAHGADVNARGESGETPLIEACWKESIDTIKLLVEHDAFIDAEDKYGGTALFYAVSKGNIEAIKLFLRHHANPNLRYEDGLTPLGYLLQWKQHDRNETQIIRLLKAAGATK